MEQTRTQSYWTYPCPFWEPNLRNCGVYPITQAGYKAPKSRRCAWDELCNKTTHKIRKGYPDYSRGRRNSKPKRRISPADSWRKTLATIGGVSLGTKLEDAGEGAGIVK